ncbi:MAG: nucleoside triphosphate pyrophosphohydrolase [Chloroflexi bacterium]|nr:nucleoside triphosphate pyrophosphohydrolase [Chloroflexota bacterium]
MLTILGLGPGDPQLLTREAWDTLSAASEVTLRTRKHPTIPGLPGHLILHDFDELYERGDDFADVYAHITEAIIAAAQQGDVIYAVPGHPLVGEATVHAILRRARASHIETRIVAGLSFIEPVIQAIATSRRPHAAALKSVDPLDGLQVCDALELAALHHPSINPDKPALVAQLYSRAVASDVKLTLMNQYPPEYKVWVVRGGGERGSRGAEESCSATQLHLLDHSDSFDPLTSLYIPALPAVGGFEGLQETVAYLRAPNGCPWDREQTHETLRKELLEEVYEVLAAIDEGDLVGLQEELGDVLLNVIMLVQIASEAEQFRMIDVIGEIDAKLKRRHPHVFGDVVVNSVGDVLTNWNVIKQQEHDNGGKPARESAIDGIPPALPALAQAQKLAHKAERAGFRFDNHEQRLAKSHEELDEVITARDNEHRKEELGDLLFTIADVADGYHIDIETALREANLKFSRRFRAMENIVRSRNLDMAAMNGAELQAVWQEVKQGE